MAEDSSHLTGPDFEKGIQISDVADGAMVEGHAFGEAVLMARRGAELFAIGATCTHYGGALAKGLMVDCTVRCPLHHAHFDLRTGEAIAAPALNDVSCWKIEKRGERAYVTGKSDNKPEPRKPSVSPINILIVGAGAAGGAAAEMLRRQGYTGPITLIGRDQSLPYDRPNLSKDYLAGNAPEEWIPLRPADFYREHDIDTLTGTEVQTIDTSRKQVTLSDGRPLGYGALLLATGADPVHLEIPGHDLPHVCYLRTLADSRRIIEKAKNAKRVVIIGDSFIGLEVAWSLRERKLEVAVVGKHSVPLEKALGREFGSLVKKTHEANGVKFHVGRVAKIEERTVQLDDGTKLDCDFVVAGIGVRPNTTLAESAGIATKDGVLVNEFLETSVPGIFAAGDIARWPDPCAGRIRVEHWVVAQRQGQNAARNILGAGEPFVAPPFFWSNHFDVHIHYVGHGGAGDRARVSGDVNAKDASVIFQFGEKVTAVASIGRNLENLEAELALERGEQKWQVTSDKQELLRR